MNDAVSSIQNLVGSLNTLKSTLNSTINSTNSNKLKDNVDSSTKALMTLKNAMNFGAIYIGLRKAWNTMSGISTEYINMIETNNLFEVSMGKVVDEYGNLDETASQYYIKAIDFQNEMNEKLATNRAELMKYQAMYYSMFKSQNIDKDSSYLMSESLTKAGYDIASLYNLSVDEAMRKIKSGIAGQVEPLRTIGIDISESSLSKVLSDVGITDRTVTQLSYAEKEVARYIAILDQAKQAQGDFARTFEQPANQIKVFQNQLAELKQVAGAFIINVFGNILVYVNAIIMVVKEILKSLAGLFGYDLSSGGADLSTTTGVDGLNDGLSSASKKAKELKKQLMGFDEINNIDPASQTSGSSGSGSSAGTIDDKLLDSLKEWDNMMGSISGKAQEIRDRILEWLGVTDGSYNNLKKILEIAQIIGAVFLTWKVSSAITNLLSNLGVLSKTQAFQLAFGLTLLLSGIFAQYKGTKRLLDGDVDLFSILETLLGTTAGAFGIVSILKATKFGKALSLGNKLKIGFGVMLAIQGVQVLADGIQTGDIKNTILGALELTGSLGIALNGAFGGKLLQSIKNSMSGVKNFSSAINISTGVVGKHATSLVGASSSMKNLAKTAGTVVGGLAGIAAGSSLTYATMKDFTTGTIDTTEAVFKLTGGLAAATASGVLAGSQFGLVGMAIGGVAGLTTSAITAFMGYKDGIESLGIPTTNLTDEIQSLTEELDANRKAHEENVKSIKDTYENQLVEAEYAQKLSGQLNGLVDVNGRVKKGNEERVKFILGELNGALGTEYKLNGDIISQNGEVVDSYKDLQDSIKDTIEAKKKEAEQTVITDLYKESIKEQIKLERDKMKAKETFAKAESKYNELMSKGISKWTLEHDESCKQIIQDYIDTADALNKTRDEYWEVTDDVQYYSQQMTDNIVENTGKLSEEMVTQGQISSEKLQEIVTTNKDEWEKTYNELNTIQQSAMLAQSTTLDNWSPTIEQKWKDMATKSSTDFLNAISQVEPETQKKILSTVSTTENMTPEMATAWSNLANKSFTDFSSALSQVEPGTQTEILKAISKTGELTPTMKMAWASLASNSKERYNQALAGLDTDTRNKIQSAVNEINNKQSDMRKAGGDIASKGIEGSDNKIKNPITGISSVGKWFVNGFISALTGGGYSVWKAGWNLIGNAISGGNARQKTGSPAKETIKMGNFFTEGYIVGLKKKQEEIRKVSGNLAGIALNEFSKLNNGIELDESFKELNNGISINTKDFAVDTNQYINYGAIKGQIQSQSKVIVGDITGKVGQACYDAFVRAMRDEGINVNIEAKTEEGVIVEKASQGFNEYVMQTGELPFPIPV